MKDSRIALRLTSREREQIELLIQKGCFRNISSVVRQALQEFLKKE